MRFYAIHTLSDKTLAAIIQSLRELSGQKGLHPSDTERLEAYVREQNKRERAAKKARRAYA
jgi:hypothetical protein